MTLAIKQCTYGRIRSLAFSLFYAMLTLGVFLGGPSVDFVRNVVGTTTIIVAHNAYVFSAYRMIFFIGFLLTLVSFFVIFFFYREIDVEEDHGGERTLVSQNSVC